MTKIPARILAASVILASSALPAAALGFFPPRDGKGTVSTPAPIAGGGLIWISIVGIGAYLVYRKRRDRD